MEFIGKSTLVIFALHFIFIDLYTMILTNIFNKDIIAQKNLSVIQVIIGFCL